MKVKRRGVIKILLSGTLLLYAIVTSILTRNLLVAVAMLSSTIGDIFLMSNKGDLGFEPQKSESLEMGICAFACAHLAYILAMRTEKFFISALISGIAICAMTIIHIAPEKKKDQEQKAHYILYELYAICILANAANAWMYSLIAGIGMTLFLISDIVVCISIGKNPKWQLITWTTYVPAQALLITATLIH